MAKIWTSPWAATGDKRVIPDAAQPDGSVSNSTGWGFDYERPYVDPLSKDIDREGMNGVLNAVTDGLGEIQKQGAPSWSADAAPYPIWAVVYHAGSTWQNSVAANSATPGVGGSNWIDRANQDPTTTIRGMATVATNAEITAGSNNTKIITPLGAASALRIDPTTAARGMPFVATAAEVTTGTDNTKMATPLALAGSFKVDPTTAVRGMPFAATAAEVTTGTNSTKMVTPAAASSSFRVDPTTIARGMPLVATAAEVTAGTDNTKMPTALAIAGSLKINPTTTVRGMPLLASAAEMTAGTEATKMATPLLTANSTRINPTASVRGMPFLASVLEAQGWVNDDKMISPAKLNSAFQGSNQSLLPSGFQKLPGGLIIQWGGVAVAANTTSTFTYPTAFTTIVFSVVGSRGIGSAAVYNFASLSNTQFRAQNTAASTETGNWIAIGY